MSTVTAFGRVAGGLARNPLGIIALFIVLIYGFAVLAFSLPEATSPAERIPLVWFLVVFPVIVLCVFGWLVSCHHEKLYAPRDFKSDASFLDSVAAKSHLNQARRQALEMKSRIVEALESQSPLDGGLDNETFEKVSEAVDVATSVNVALPSHPDVEYASVSMPVSAFDNFGEFTSAIYFEIENIVAPFEYGHSWVLRDLKSGSVIKNARMIVSAPPGAPVPDGRSLAEVGIIPGAKLSVELLRERLPG